MLGCFSVSFGFMKILSKACVTILKGRDEPHRNVELNTNEAIFF